MNVKTAGLPSEKVQWIVTSYEEGDTEGRTSQVRHVPRSEMIRNRPQRRYVTRSAGQGPHGRNSTSIRHSPHFAQEKNLEKLENDSRPRPFLVKLPQKREVFFPLA